MWLSKACADKGDGLVCPDQPLKILNCIKQMSFSVGVRKGKVERRNRTMQGEARGGEKLVGD